MSQSGQHPKYPYHPDDPRIQPTQNPLPPLTDGVWTKAEKEAARAEDPELYDWLRRAMRAIEDEP